MHMAILPGVSISSTFTLCWQGVQAQTVANFYLAFERDLVVIPVLNKIDLKTAKPEEVSEQLETLFDIGPWDILAVRTGRLGFAFSHCAFTVAIKNIL